MQKALSLVEKGTSGLDSGGDLTSDLLVMSHTTHISAVSNTLSRMQ